MRLVKVGGLIALLVAVLAACVSMGNAKFSLAQKQFLENYPRIKEIVVEEAANNGFGSLTSEIKPSEFNDWTGKLFFQLKTANGTDQLFVEFSKDANGVNIWVHGAGTRSNPDSAAKAIQARLSRLPANGTQRPAIVLTAPITASRAVESDPLKETKPVASPYAVANPGWSMLEVQRRLNALGYKVGLPDGVTGKRTTDAIKKFQEESQLESTGVVDDRTWTKLVQRTTAVAGKPSNRSGVTPLRPSAAKVKQDEL